MALLGEESMNLKSACKTALVLVMVSIILKLIGSALFYIPAIVKDFGGSTIIFLCTMAATTLLPFILQTAGLFIFFIAFMKSLKKITTDPTIAFILAGILILLGSLITAAFPMRHISFSNIKLMLTFGIIFLSGLSLSIFIFTLIKKALSAKPLAAVTLGINLASCGLMIVNQLTFLQAWSQDNILYPISMTISLLSYLSHQAAIFLFLLTFLKHRPWPPMAGVADDSPDPVPTLSEHASVPEEEQRLLIEEHHPDHHTFQAAY